MSSNTSTGGIVMVNNYSDIYDGIATGEKVSADKMTAALNQMEQVKFRENTLSGSQDKYPSSQAVLNALDGKEAGLPAGIIFPYAGATAPTGWAFCDGAAYSRTTYKKLFDAINTTWGAGNGSTTFNIPDLRGATMRGVGTSSGFVNTQNNQTDNVTVALAQRDNDAIRNITGTIFPVARRTDSVGLNGDGAFVDTTVTNSSFQSSGAATVSITGVKFNASNVVPTASENKVKARGVNFIIKLI